MKNSLCVLVGLGCIAAWYYSRPEPVAAPALATVAAAAPQKPREFYHSPLDAPAMLSSDHTNQGYYSAAPGGFDAAYTSSLRTVGGSTAGGATHLGHPYMGTAQTAPVVSRPVTAAPVQRTLPGRTSTTTALTNALNSAETQ